MSAAADYNAFPYDNLPFEHARPEWLGVLGRLHGINAAPARTARVLELGCGLGGHLLPLAELMPEAQFVGVDASARQIEQAQADATALGLKNITFQVADLQQLGARMGRFDYVICHGVYSWVKPAVQSAILRLCAMLLTPEGLGYVSFNALPGWHARRIVSDLAQLVDDPELPPKRRTARAREFMGFIAQHAPVDSSPLAGWLRSEVEQIGRLSDRYLFHEHFSTHSEALYLPDFLTRAREFGLRYVTDAELESTDLDRFGARVEGYLRKRCGDRMAVERALDFLDPRYFRRAVLCGSEAAPLAQPDAEALQGLLLESSLRPFGRQIDLRDGYEMAFIGPDRARFTTGEPLLKAALLHLGEQSNALPFAAVYEAVTQALPDESAAPEPSQLAECLLPAVLAGHIRPCMSASAATFDLSDAPQALGFARRQAARREDGITTARHTSLRADPFDHALIRRLDGSHNRSALLAELVAAATDGTLKMSLRGEPLHTADQLAPLLDSRLERYRQAGLLVG